MPSNAAFITSNVTGYVTPGLLTTFMAMTGDSDVDQYQHIALATFIFFLFLVNIVMFNVLIAIVSEIYDNTMATAPVDVRKRQAEVIIQQEGLMSTADLGNADYFPEFLEVLVKTKDGKPVGLVKEEVTSETIAGEMTELKASQQKMEVELKASQQKMEVKVDELSAKMATEVSELKAMMAQLIEQTRPQ